MNTATLLNATDAAAAAQTALLEKINRCKSPVTLRRIASDAHDRARSAQRLAAYHAEDGDQPRAADAAQAADRHRRAAVAAADRADALATAVTNPAHKGRLWHEAARNADWYAADAHQFADRAAEFAEPKMVRALSTGGTASAA